jgi:DNA mismatch endonuclease, patch repair protein
MDTVTVQERSRIMAAVKSKQTRSTELRLRFSLVRAGVRGWRYQAPHLMGKPDFVFAAYRTAIFVDGCFWHGCPRCYRRPHSRREYWDAKVRDNIRRDRRTRAFLKRQGWQILRIWEHELARNRHKCILRIKAVLSRTMQRTS